MHLRFFSAQDLSKTQWLRSILLSMGLLDELITGIPIIALVIISASCAGWYPLAKSEAYARKPAHANMVNTVISLGAPFEMVLPATIGLISANFGIIAGLTALGSAPILMLLLLPYQHDHKI